MAECCPAAHDQMWSYSVLGCLRMLLRKEGTCSRSRDGAEDLFLLAKYSALSARCAVLHLLTVLMLASFSKFAQFANNLCTGRPNWLNQEA